MSKCVCPDCNILKTETELDRLKAENARFSEALRWMLSNQSLIIFAENEEHVSHFMSKAREALKGAE